MNYHRARRSVGFLASAAAVLFGCQRDEPSAAAPTTEQVAERPVQYLGKELTLIGEVDEVYGDRAFELEGDGWIDDSLLVLTRSPVRLSGGMLKDDDRVSVTGTVRSFMVAELERELGWDLTPELEIEWRSKNALVAESISAMTESARWSEKDAKQGALVGLVSFFYVPDPATLVGQELELERVPVREVQGKAVWVGAQHSDQLLVAPAGGAQLPALAAGDELDVEGTLRKMPPAKDAIERWGLKPALRSEISEEVVYLEARELKKSSVKDAKQSQR